MAAVLERSRRATAGQRMSGLVGKAAEEDDTFWNHSTWAETTTTGDDDDVVSEDGSYQEEEEVPVDAFDSDFNDSEDSSDEDEAIDEEAQAVAQEQDANDKQKKSSYSDPQQQQQRNKGAAYVDAVTAGRELLQRKRGSKDSKKRRGMGEGMNAGIVLNLPGQARPLHSVMGPTIIASVPTAAGASSVAAGATTTPIPIKPTIIPAPPMVPIIRTRRAATSTDTAGTIDSTTSPLAIATTITAATTTATATPSNSIPNKARKLRKSTVSKTARAVSSDVHTRSSGKVALVDSAISTDGSDGGATKTVYKMGKGRRRFTQEELLVEAANMTEPNNERWMLGRKRGQEQDSMASSSMQGGGHRQRDFYSGNGAWRIVEKFHSRRGCYNTLTFPEMDLVPELLVTQGHRPPRRQIPIPSSSLSSPNINADPSRCVITGKKARYRDPKTMCGYHDIAAFRELRRRLEAGESLDQSSSSSPSTKQTNTTPVIPSKKRSNSSISAPLSSTKRLKTTTATTTTKTKTTVTKDNNMEAPQPKSIQSSAANGGMTTRRHTLPSPLGKPVIKEEVPTLIPPLIATNGASVPATAVIQKVNGSPAPQPKSSAVPMTASSLPSKGSVATAPISSAPLSKDTKVSVAPNTTASSLPSNGTVTSATSAPLSSKDTKKRIVPKTVSSAPSKNIVTATTSNTIATPSSSLPSKGTSVTTPIGSVPLTKNEKSSVVVPITPSSSLPSNGTSVATPSSLSKDVATLGDPPTTVPGSSTPAPTKSRLLAPSPNSLVSMALATYMSGTKTDDKQATTPR